MERGSSKFTVELQQQIQVTEWIVDDQSVTATSFTIYRIIQKWRGSSEVGEEVKMRFSSNDSLPLRGNNCPPLSQLGVQILRTDIAVAKANVVQLTIQLREISQTSKKQLTAADSRSPRYGKEGDFSDSRELHSTGSAIQPVAHIYRELYDSASSIVTEILRHPRLIVNAMAYIADSNTSSSSSGQAVTGFIAVNRILHPYFTDSSATTSLLLEAIIHQTE